MYAGAVFTNAIDLFIVLACAATLYREGVAIDAAEDAARALAPVAGRLAELLFGFGLLNVSILGAAILPLTTAYAVCEAFGFESGLDKKRSEAPAFHGLLTAFILVPALVAIIPGLPLVKVIVLSQDVNGILLPIILIYVLKIINDPRVMGEHVNTRTYNVIAWAFSLALIGLSVTLVASPPCFWAVSAFVLALVRARLDVDEHVRVGHAFPDVPGDVLGDLVGLGDGERLLHRDVQVDVTAAARLPGAQAVVAHDELAAVVLHAARGSARAPPRAASGPAAPWWTGPRARTRS